MTNVRWPTEDAELARAVSSRLLAEHGVRFSTYSYAKAIYSRLCAQVYLQRTQEISVRFTHDSCNHQIVGQRHELPMHFCPS